jgi:acyl-CoA synthetase (AMP-forming)/AMP-acid ligase II
MTVVVKTDGQPYLCKTDEVGEICLSSGYTGTGYWGLHGITNSMFKVQALMPEGNPISEQPFVRTGLLGFLGPVSMSSLALWSQLQICDGVVWAVVEEE